MSGPGARVLYVSYDGLLEPLGQSQVLAYLRGLAPRHRITLLTYEKPADWAVEARRRRMVEDVRRAGIRWIALGYHNSPAPFAAAFDLAVGLLLGLGLSLRRRFDIVHARSDPPAAVAWALKRLLGTRFLYDTRGFWADQRADSGRWSRQGRSYRTAKWFETMFLREADGIVVLTRAAAEVLRTGPELAASRAPLAVITTCADLALFTPADRAPNPPRPFTVGLIGSIGPWYLFDEMLRCFHCLLEAEPEARLRILNRDSHPEIRRRMEAAGIPPDRVELKSVPHEAMPGELRDLDAAILLLRPVASHAGAMPTKLGEFLACGVPCLANAGIGDLDEVLGGSGAGIILRGLEPEDMRRGARELLALARDPGTRVKCLAAARRHFSLEDGIRAYDELYRNLARRPS